MPRPVQRIGRLAPRHNMRLYRQWRQADHDELAARVLGMLPGPTAAPMSTPEVRQRCHGLDTYERELYVRQALDRLVVARWVELVRPEGAGCLFWRRTMAGDAARKRDDVPPR